MTRHQAYIPRLSTNVLVLRVGIDTECVMSRSDSTVNVRIPGPRPTLNAAEKRHRWMKGIIALHSGVYGGRGFHAADFVLDV